MCSVSHGEDVCCVRCVDTVTSSNLFVACSRKEIGRIAHVSCVGLSRVDGEYCTHGSTWIAGEWIVHDDVVAGLGSSLQRHVCPVLR